MVYERRRVAALHYNIRLGEALFHISRPKVGLSYDIAALMYLWGVGEKGFLWRRNDGQGPVGNFDGVPGSGSDLRCFRKNNGHGVAHVPHFFITEDWLVGDDLSESVAPGNVFGGKDGGHTGHPLGSIGVDGDYL